MKRKPNNLDSSTKDDIEMNDPQDNDKMNDDDATQDTEYSFDNEAWKGFLSNETYRAKCQEYIALINQWYKEKWSQFFCKK